MRIAIQRGSKQSKGAKQHFTEDSISDLQSFSCHLGQGLSPEHDLSLSRNCCQGLGHFRDEVEEQLRLELWVMVVQLLHLMYFKQRHDRCKEKQVELNTHRTCTTERLSQNTQNKCGNALNFSHERRMWLGLGLST